MISIRQKQCFRQMAGTLGVSAVGAVVASTAVWSIQGQRCALSFFLGALVWCLCSGVFARKLCKVLMPQVPQATWKKMRRAHSYKVVSSSILLALSSVYAPEAIWVFSGYMFSQLLVMVPIRFPLRGLVHG